MNLRPNPRSRALWSRLSSMISLYIAAFIFPLILTSLPVPAAEKHPHSMMLPPLLPFTDDGGHCAHWGLQCCRNFSVPSPDLCLDTILSQRSTDNSLDFLAWFVLWHALSTMGPYIDRCVPFQITSNQLNLTQVDSNQVELNFECHGKGYEYLCTCDYFCFLFLIYLQKFPANVFRFVIIGYCM